MKTTCQSCHVKRAVEEQNTGLVGRKSVRAVWSACQQQAGRKTPSLCASVPVKSHTIQISRSEWLTAAQQSVAACQSASQKATQKLSLPVSTSEVPSGCHAAPLARKPDSGMCTQDAPSGVHRYSLGSPVHSTRRLEAGHQAAERTGRAWTSRLASASERVSHTHTACGMESQRVAMKLPSWLHATLPAGGGAVWWGGQGVVVKRMQRLAGTW